MSERNTSAPVPALVAAESTTAPALMLDHEHRIEPLAPRSRPAPLEALNYESSPALLFSKTSSDAKPLPPNQGPQFVAEASKNVTALAGRVASLTCRIKNLDNWTVSITMSICGHPISN